MRRDAASARLLLLSRRLLRLTVFFLCLEWLTAGSFYDALTHSVLSEELLRSSRSTLEDTHKTHGVTFRLRLKLAIRNEYDDDVYSSEDPLDWVIVLIVEM